ncbi:MAG TPA: YraN family protein [Candidatus Bathyarchaeia archaeon]|nr:YraN family protein [Candidatus Bathyarchaeia archaeon]
MNNNIDYGKKGEYLVARHLEQQGFSIIARNYRKPYGEVDLIARKRNELTFVEVKMRRNPLVDPATVITTRKQRSIGMVVKEYLASHNMYDTMTARCDVALVIQSATGPTIQYIDHAFTIDD